MKCAVPPGQADTGIVLVPHVAGNGKTIHLERACQLLKNRLHHDSDTDPLQRDLAFREELMPSGV